MPNSTRLYWRGVVALAGLGLLLTRPCAAQHTSAQPAAVRDNNATAWLTFYSDARLTQRWGLHTEAQWKRAKGLQNPQENVFRVGASYHASRALLLTAGYAYAQAFPYGNDPSVNHIAEHRTYQQLQLRDTKGFVRTQHRYRLEQRWIESNTTPAYTYLNRMRYQLRLAAPLLGREIKPGVPYAVVADEVFVGFGRRAEGRIFDQNRAYAALGYQVSTATALEVGYLNQLWQPRGTTTYSFYHTVQMGLTFNPDFRRTLPALASAQ